MDDLENQKKGICNSYRHEIVLQIKKDKIPSEIPLSIAKQTALCNFDVFRVQSVAKKMNKCNSYICNGFFPAYFTRESHTSAFPEIVS